MTKQDVLDYYGGTVAAARALGRSKGAVSQWDDELPLNLQYEIQGRTGGKLKADATNPSSAHEPARQA